MYSRVWMKRPKRTSDVRSNRRFEKEVFDVFGPRSMCVMRKVDTGPLTVSNCRTTGECLFETGNQESDERTRKSKKNRP